MSNLYLYKTTVYESNSHAPSGLQGFFIKDVSSMAGCINRLLPSTLRYVAIA
jgi:hypothetical protein